MARGVRSSVIVHVCPYPSEQEKTPMLTTSLHWWWNTKHIRGGSGCQKLEAPLHLQVHPFLCLFSPQLVGMKLPLGHGQGSSSCSCEGCPEPPSSLTPVFHFHICNPAYLVVTHQVVALTAGGYSCGRDWQKNRVLLIPPDFLQDAAT